MGARFEKEKTAPSAMSQRAATGVLAAAAFLFLGGCESLPGRTGGRVVLKDEDATVAVVFSDGDRQLIADYYSGKKKNKLPPGLAKKDRLPPGLEKQLRKNGEVAAWTARARTAG